MFHIHKWVDEGVTHNKGHEVKKLEQGVEAELDPAVVDYLLGYTNFRQRCSKCGKISVVKARGNA